jgi:hypothetical protein
VYFKFVGTSAQYVVEANNGRYYRKAFKSKDDLVETPHWVDIEKTTVAFETPPTFPVEGIVLSVGKPRHHHIGTDCTLYVLNNDGKTIDKLGCKATPSPQSVKEDYSAGLPRARSIREWVSGKQFLALKHELRPKQLEVLSHLFGEVCPHCSSFETGGVVAPIFKNGKCSLCGHKRSLENLPQELCAIWGSRSGKGFVAAAACSYILHRLLCIHDLPGYYRLPEGTKCVHGLIGDNHPRFVWDTVVKYWNTTPWFRNYRKAGGATTKPGLDCIIFPNGLVLEFLQYKQGRVPRGHVAFGCFAELGTNAPGTSVFFDLAENGTQVIRKKEDELRSNCGLTSPGGLLLSFSTPTGVDSFLKECVEKEKRGDRVLVSKLPTWELNPHFSEEELQESEPDEIRFRREFGAELI